MSGLATMEDAVLGDPAATVILQVSQGEQLAGRHHSTVTALQGQALNLCKDNIGFKITFDIQICQPALFI